MKGTGALIAAAEHGDLGAVKILLKQGEKNGDLGLKEIEEYGVYDPKKLDDQRTALYNAAAEGTLGDGKDLAPKGSRSKILRWKGLVCGGRCRREWAWRYCEETEMVGS